MMNMLFKDRNEKIIFSLAIIWHLIFFLLIYFKSGWTGFYWGDAEGYIQIAKNLLGGNGFSLSDVAPFMPDGWRTPMYPILLSGILFIFKNLYFVSLAQILLFSFGAILIYRLAKDFLGEKAALIASLFLILEPTMAYWNVMFLSETLFFLFFILGIYFFVKFYKSSSFFAIFAAASFLGFATLTRPVAQGLWFLILVFILFLIKKIGVKCACLSFIIFLVSFVSVVSPWLIRNKVLFNTYSFSSADANASMDNLGAYIRFNPLENFKGNPPQYLLDLIQKNSKLPIFAHDLNYRSYFMKRWFNLILADPVGYSEVHLISLIPYFLGDGYTELARQFFPGLYRPGVISWDHMITPFSFLFDHQGVEAVIFWAGKLFWVLIYFAAILGAINLLKRKEYLYLILFLIIIFYFALTAGIIAYSRYRFAVNPFIFILAAAGLRYLRELLRFKSK